MTSRRLRGCTAVVLLLGLASAAPSSTGLAEHRLAQGDSQRPATAGFERTWARTDLVVRDLVVNRTWLWGPTPLSAAIWEPYDEAPAGRRLVQYFDKSRMERNDWAPQAPESIWRVTNGRLAWELIAGQVQLGDQRFEQREPAAIGLAGDPNDPSVPTYASLSLLLGASPHPGGEPITTRLAVGGATSDDSALAAHGAVASQHVQLGGIDHRIASPFWSFMTSSGRVFEHGLQLDAALFSDPFYATGYPITEAYWLASLVDGAPRDVLVQCFERRCLTWTPGNPIGWEVETGNIGQHYFSWRYRDGAPQPALPRDYLLIALDPGHDASTGGALGVEHVDTLRTALAAQAALASAGYSVYLTRPNPGALLVGDPALMPPNSAAVDAGYSEGYAHLSAALQRDPDIIVSLHFNGSSDPATRGTAVYFSPAGGGQNSSFANLMIAEITRALNAVGYEPPYALALDDVTIGKTYGGLATLGNLYPTGGNRIYGVPAVLLEPLFETNPAERAIIERAALHQELANAIVRAIGAYLAAGAGP